MRTSSSPSIIPSGGNDTVHLVVDCFGNAGCVWREADIGATDFQSVVTDLLRGEYSDPLRVVAFNTTEKWSKDVTAEVAHEIKSRCDRADEDVPATLEDLVQRHVRPGVEPQLSFELVADRPVA